MKWTPRLRTVLLIVNVIILAMPLAAIAALRIYDNELVRQTEAELIAQGAFVEAAYGHALLDALAGQPVNSFGKAAEHPIEKVDGKFIPIAPRLDVSAERVRPPAADPVATDEPQDLRALAAGARVEAILQEAKLITFAGIRVVDGNGIIVGSTRGDERGLSIADHEEIKRALTGEFVSVLRQRISDSPRPALDSISRRTTVRVFVAMPVLIEDRVVGALVLSRTPMSIAKALYKNRSVYLAMLAVLLLGVALITVLTLVTVQRPIRALIQQTRRIAVDTSDAAPIEHPGTLELQELSEAFASMAAALGQREQYITTFARNVSHEFKTPLTSIRGSVELLQDHLDEMEPTERDEFLAVVAKDCDRLDRLVGRLLELARADVVRPGRDVADVDAVVRSVIASLQTAEFTVTVKGTADGAHVVMATETLESLVSNLIVNAREHGGHEVELGLARAAGSVEITVADNGAGIDPSDVPRVFEEFFTTARDAGGTGLGLSIVRTLVEAHGGSIQLVEAATAKFQIVLPTEPTARNNTIPQP